MQGFCPLFVVSLAPIIAQIAGIALCRNAFWVGQQTLITDRSNGKLYVGSATSDNGMLLQRWANYIDSGHGGNKELIELVNKEGIDYIKRNFQYSILENYNARVDDSVILERESWWKETLQSRKFGYNAN